MKKRHYWLSALVFSLATMMLAPVANASTYSQTKYPIVMVHGAWCVWF